MLPLSPAPRGAKVPARGESRPALSSTAPPPTPERPGCQ